MPALLRLQSLLCKSHEILLAPRWQAKRLDLQLCESTPVKGRFDDLGRLGARGNQQPDIFAGCRPGDFFDDGIQSVSIVQHEEGVPGPGDPVG
ncbi:MAG: hypothetical protein KDM81_13250, partial [Verrucomicrobiae bacterium]|nr:hypothetical protein [Verrucomicrobiae bacterium]